MEKNALSRNEGNVDRVRTSVNNNVNVLVC